MASRNFNFLQSYGTGVIYIPFKLRVVLVPSLQIVEQTPDNGFSVDVDLAGGVAAGLIRIRLVDGFNEYLGSHFDWFDDAGIESYVKLSSINFAPSDNLTFTLNTYTFDATAQQVDGYSPGDLSGLIVMRNSSTKF